MGLPRLGRLVNTVCFLLRLAIVTLVVSLLFLFPILDSTRANGRLAIRYLESPSKIMWVVVKIMVPFGVPNIIWHLLCRVPKKGP